MTLRPSPHATPTPPYGEWDPLRFIENTLALESRGHEPELWMEETALELALQEYSVQRKVASLGEASDVTLSTVMAAVFLPFSG